MTDDDRDHTDHDLRPTPLSVLVTGVHRRLGPEFVTRLLERDDVARVLAADQGPCPVALHGLDPTRFSYVPADLRKRRAVDNLFLAEFVREDPIDTVVHLAFQGNPLGYDLKGHEFNIHATRHLLDASLRHRVGKFIFLSSDAVYKLGPRTDYRVREDAELNLDPKAHPILRDTLDAEFLCRAKMDSATCEVMVLRPSGVFGGGVISGINLLFESDPPLLPVGFDPMINPTNKDRLVCDLLLAAFLHGKGVYNVAGPRVGPISEFLAERRIPLRRVPGPLLRPLNKLQRALGKTRYHAGFNPGRLYYSLVLDDSRFTAAFRRKAARVFPDPNAPCRAVLADVPLGTQETS